MRALVLALTVFGLLLGSAAAAAYWATTAEPQVVSSYIQDQVRPEEVASPAQIDRRRQAVAVGLPLAGAGAGAAAGLGAAWWRLRRSRDS